MHAIIIGSISLQDYSQMWLHGGRVVRMMYAVCRLLEGQCSLELRL